MPKLNLTAHTFPSMELLLKRAELQLDYRKYTAYRFSNIISRMINFNLLRSWNTDAHPFRWSEKSTVKVIALCQIQSNNDTAQTNEAIAQRVKQSADRRLISAPFLGWAVLSEPNLELLCDHCNQVMPIYFIGHLRWHSLTESINIATLQIVWISNLLKFHILERFLSAGTASRSSNPAAA